MGDPENPQDTVGASKHVEYEIRTLRETFELLVTGKVPKDSPLHDPVLESFAVHVRNLIEFLYDPPKRADDDVRADHFFSDPERWRKLAGEKPEEFAEAQRKANKQISHITYTRAQISQAEKEWMIFDLAQRLIDVLRTSVLEADEDRMGERLLAVRKATQDALAGGDEYAEADRNGRSRTTS